MEKIFNNGLILPQSGHEITSKEEMSYDDGAAYVTNDFWSFSIHFSNYEAETFKKVANGWLIVEGIVGSAIVGYFGGVKAGLIVSGLYALCSAAFSHYWNSKNGPNGVVLNINKVAIGAFFLFHAPTAITTAAFLAACLRKA